MKRVTGIGGIFIKAEHPGWLYEWYEKHLGIVSAPHGQGAMLHWRVDENPERRGPRCGRCEKHSKYFDPSRSPFMVNYRVDGLDALRGAAGGGRPVDTEEHGRAG